MVLQDFVDTRQPYLTLSMESKTRCLHNLVRLYASPKNHSMILQQSLVLVYSSQHHFTETLSPFQLH